MGRGVGGWREVSIIALLLALTAGPAGAREVADMLGRRVTVPERPARVVSLAPSLTETVYALGAEGLLVGVTDHCDYPAAAKEKPRIGGYYTPDLERILSLRPDLVVATTEVHREESLRSLERLAVPTYVLRAVDVRGVLDAVGRVGALLGRGEDAARLVGALADRAAAVSRAVRGSPRPSVLYLLWGDPLVVPGRATLITDLLDWAGGRSVTAEERLPYLRFSLEEALARRPERVVVALDPRVPLEARLGAWPQLRLFPAVGQGRIHQVDPDLMHRPGPRIVQALEVLARLLHPELGW